MQENTGKNMDPVIMLEKEEESGEIIESRHQRGHL